MEKVRFLSFYKRELDRINRFNIHKTAEENQKSEYSFHGEYSETKRLIHAIDSIESTYNNSGADNLDFADQVTMNEFISQLRQVITEYIYSLNNNYSLDIIEEMITLANLYLGMQVLHYPAFIRLVRKKYIDNELLSQTNEIDFEIPSYQNTLQTLHQLELDNLNRRLPENERKELINRYERELKRLNKYQNGKENVYKNIYEYDLEEEKITKLVTNMKSIKKKIYDKIMKSSYEYSKKEELLRFITDLEYAVYNYENYSPTILEMMIEIANLLLNMEIKNPKAFEILVENHYIEDYIITDNDITIRSFDETYEILRSFIKRF